MPSQEPRCRYGNNQLGEVICQLRFPEILSITTTVPDKFQDAIRAEFPRYSVRREISVPKPAPLPGSLPLPKQEPTINHQFLSADGIWRVNLTSKFVSLTCSKYVCWEDFAGMLDKPLAAFIQIYQPAYFERVGLRYVNFFSRLSLDLSHIPFRELIEPCYLGPMAMEQVPETNFSRCSVDADMALRGGCRVRVHAGPGIISRNGKPDKEVKFILDLDLYMSGQVSVNTSAGALQTLHSQAWPVFRSAITDKLHDALDPN